MPAWILSFYMWIQILFPEIFESFGNSLRRTGFLYESPNDMIEWKALESPEDIELRKLGFGAALLAGC